MSEEPTRTRDADRSRAAILDAAESLFSAHGYEAVTMAHVGAAAGVSRGTPGYFFGSKEALYRVVVERAAATLRMLAHTLRVRDAAATRDPATVVAETVDAFLALLTARRSIVALIDRAPGPLASRAHADAMRDALSGLGPDAERVAPIALAMCWFPLSQPEAARALGVDPDAPGFVADWTPRVLAAAGMGGAPPPPAPAPTGAGVVKKKKKKKKKT